MVPEFLWDVLACIGITAIIVIVVIFLVHLLMGDDSPDQQEYPEDSEFSVLEDNPFLSIVYHKQTKVMYVISQGAFTLLVDADGKPMIYKEKEN